MLKAWIQWIKLTDSNDAEPTLHQQRVAAAVLLFEVAKSDFKIEAVELVQLRRSLQQHWQLSDEELNAVVSDAEQQSDQLHSLHDPVQTLLQHFNDQERADLIQSLWEVAFADQQIDAHEEHLIRRLADLLHVPHREFIARKLLAEPT